VEDDRTSNAGAVAALQLLVTQHPHLAAIIGPMLSTEVQAMTPLIEQYQIPVLVGGTDPKITHEGDRWIFRVRPNDEYSARTMAYFVIKRLGLRRVAVVHSTDAFGTGGNQYLQKWVPAYGGQIVLDEGYTNGSTDYTSIVEAIAKAHPQAVIAYFTLPPDMAIFLRQMKLLGVSLPLMGSATITSTNVVRLLGKTLNGDYATTDFVANSNPVAEAFAQAFEARYHKRADIDSSSSWDAVRILATAMRHYGTSHPAIRKGILSLRNFPGAESPGHYNFDPNGDGLQGYSVVQFQGAAEHLVESFDFYSPGGSGRSGS
jgi:branched-chain amino acid transport system substrate-binding protein